MEILGGILVLTIMVLFSGIKVVKEHDQLVVFRLGKLAYSLGPGVHLVVPLIDQSHTVDTRIVTITTPVLEELTCDHVTVKISAVCLFSVADAKRKISKIEDANKAVSELVQTSLRTIVSQHDLKHLISDRGRMNHALKSKLEKQTREWGLKINIIEIKEMKIPKEMRKALVKTKRHGDHHELHVTRLH